MFLTSMMMSFKVLLSTCTDMMILKNLMLTFMMTLNFNLMMILKNLMSIVMILDRALDYNEF